MHVHVYVSGSTCTLCHELMCQPLLAAHAAGNAKVCEARVNARKSAIHELKSITQEQNTGPIADHIRLMAQEASDDPLRKAQKRQGAAEIALNSQPAMHWTAEETLQRLEREAKEKEEKLAAEALRKEQKAQKKEENKKKKEQEKIAIAERKRERERKAKEKKEENERKKAERAERLAQGLGPRGGKKGAAKGKQGGGKKKAAQTPSSAPTPEPLGLTSADGSEGSQLSPPMQRRRTAAHQLLQVAESPCGSPAGGAGRRLARSAGGEAAAASANPDRDASMSASRGASESGASESAGKGFAAAFAWGTRRRRGALGDISNRRR